MGFCAAFVSLAWTLDGSYSCAWACPMKLNLSPELHAKLAHIAAENNGDAEEYVRQLVSIILTMTHGSGKRSGPGLVSSTAESPSPTKKSARASISCYNLKCKFVVRSW